MRRVSILIIGLLSIVSVAIAQRSKSIPTPVKWLNNNNILMSEWAENGLIYFKYNIKNGKREEIESPKMDDRLYLSVKKGDIYLREADGKERQLTSTEADERNPVLSPDAKRVAFTRDNDLYSIEIETGNETRYTTDGTNLILNGWASWVYYEEIFGRSSRYQAFWWSPDSKQLAFYRFDDTKVPLFPIYYSNGQHGYLQETRYPKAGDPNPEVKIGFVSADGGEIVWADFDVREDQYFGMPYWSATSDKLFVQWLNRDQNSFIIYSVNRADGSKKPIYKEKQGTWIDWIEDVRFGKDGFYFVRDFELWEQIYFQPYNGDKLVKLTDGNNWGIKIVDIDDSAGEIYYMSRKEISTRYDLYRVRWNSKKIKEAVAGERFGEINRLSIGEYNYAFPMLSPDKRSFVALASNVSTPYRVLLIEGKKSKVLFDLAQYGFDKSSYPRREMRFIKTSDGYTLPAVITLPENFDPNKQYPVIVDVYGGPNSGIVMDSWRNKTYSSDFWAKEGVIQISVDNRSSGHCGKEGMNFIHRRLGKYEISDLIEWGRYIASLPYVKPDRVGINGFSFGGTMTVMALSIGSEFFKYGIAGGGVYDWRLYDSHYTERYMDTPKDNPDGYREAAAINYVKRYKPEREGDPIAFKSLLLLTHGTGDDNVHLQNTMQLVDALQREGRHFELMLYPGGMHGYRGYQGEFSGEEDILFWRKTLLR